jgi:predicted TIM-barrel fold metal-dependent hydrolase
MASDFDRLEWIGLTREEPVDPERRIIDAHHHLWDHGEGRTYLLDDFLADTGAGHKVTDSVFVECGTSYRQDGPKALRPVGETAFVAEHVRKSEGCATCVAAIVAFADLSAGDAVEEVLGAHEAAGEGRFRGVRHSNAWDASLEAGTGRRRGSRLMTQQRVRRGIARLGDSVRHRHYRPAPGLMAQEHFRRGVARLGDNGYSFDAWVYHPQLTALADLARAADGTTIVLDHFGAPLNVGPYRDRHDARHDWQQGMREMAACPNVVVKLGGVGMDHLFGTGWSARARPPGSDEVAHWWRDHICWCIDTFGPSRCMFESNYPVDRQALGYTVIWNAFQKVAAAYSDPEQDDLFSATAARVYRIP